MLVKVGVNVVYHVKIMMLFNFFPCVLSMRN